MKSTTSSYRVPQELQLRLEQTARYLKKGKNWIIHQALDEYLRQHYPEALTAEARRQSLLASSVTTEDEEFWAQQADTRGWR